MDVGELIVEAGGAIDVSGLGYRPGHDAIRTTVWRATRAAAATSAKGGQHNSDTIGETFGSVYRPQEAGGGARYRGLGGGVVRIDADRVQIDGVIRADGFGSRERQDDGGAGGSVWIRTAVAGGNGHDRGAGQRGPTTRATAAGGGGAIAVEYSSSRAGHDPARCALSATTGSYGSSRRRRLGLHLRPGLDLRRPAGRQRRDRRHHRPARVRHRDGPGRHRAARRW